MRERKHQQGPVETQLIGGFLGAGKTTFVLDQLKTTTANVAVLVNEFGTLGIDGELIRSQGGIEVVEMPGGCICCSQRLGLVESIRHIAERIAPDLLLIEPSGVAELSELLQVLTDPSLAGVVRISAVVTVIDAETFLEYSQPEAFGLFFLDQVKCADLILVNKADLVGPEVLEKIEKRIALHNPGALTVRTEFGRLGVEIPKGPGVPRHFTLRAPVPLGLHCIAAVPAGPLRQEAVQLFEKELRRGRFGRIMRGKGFIQTAGNCWLNLQIVAGKLSVRPLSTAFSPRVILIGLGLKLEELERFLAEHCLQTEEEGPTNAPERAAS